MRKRLLTLLPLLCLLLTVKGQQLAFPGAEGYGAYATGGRGCQVVHVTNLNAAGPGSLADAVSQPNRFVVFDVGGVIDITNKSITIASNITIAGQTAPGEGITIYGGRVIASKAKNIIMRYIRMRGGKSVNSSKCTLTLDECQNVIMDHCSVSWGPWDNVHIKDANNITWQHSIIAEGIEPQRFGSITDGTHNWTIHHCLWIDNKSRNPKMKCYVQYYNNVIYNYAMGIVGGHSAADNYQDVINNYFIAGPETSNAATSTKYFDQWTETDHLYSTGNYYDGNCDGQLNGTLITDYNGATPMKQPNFNTTHPMNVQSAAEAYAAVVEQVGASRVRDSHDKRYIEQLTSLGKKGAFIANEDDVNGIGNVANGQKPQDTDNDGMADDWELANGLNPNANDANDKTLGGGYTNIEHYVNSLAQKTTFLMYPMNLVAKLKDATTVQLSWTNEPNEEAVAIIVEQSEDGKNYTEIQRLAPTTTQSAVSELIPKKVYFFRLKTIGNKLESLYSAVVSVNNEFMRPGGGVDAGTTTFTPAEGKLYRIINYATAAYNSNTNLGGAPKYLTFADNGSLASSDAYEWDNPALMWQITPTDGGVTIRNYNSKKYIAAINTPIAGENRIGSSDTPAVLTINYTGDQTPSQSGINAPVSMYRINSPSNSNMQIRPRNFADFWLYGNGDLDRADMIFTFSELDASLVHLYAKGLTTTLESALTLARNAATDVTLGYPSEALAQFMTVITATQDFVNSTNQTAVKQEDIDSVQAVLNKAIASFKSCVINTLIGYSTDVCYNIYSYGTHPGARDANATTSIQRRYLYDVKTTDGLRDSLVYRLGLTDADIAAGKVDGIAADAAALWVLSAANSSDGHIFIRNAKTGAYMQVGSLLSPTPVSMRPYYAKQDNGKQAFYLDATTDAIRCFNVGQLDADGKGGPLDISTLHADRTRLRWVIQETAIEAPTFLTGVTTVRPSAATAIAAYNLQGMKIRQRPARGLYIEHGVAADGSLQVKKKLVK